MTNGRQYQKQPGQPGSQGPRLVSEPASQPESFDMRAERGLLIAGKIIAYATYIYVVFVEIMLFLRVLLLAFGANPTVGFSLFVYRTTADALAPFRGLFPLRAVGTTGYLDISALFAMIVYLLIAFAVGHLVGYLNWKVQAQQRRESGVAEDRGEDRLDQ